MDERLPDTPDGRQRWRVDWRHSDVTDTGPGDPNDFPSRRRGNGPRKLSYEERRWMLMGLIGDFEGRYPVSASTLSAGVFVPIRETERMLADLVGMGMVEEIRTGRRAMYRLARLDADESVARYDGRYDGVDTRTRAEYNHSWYAEHRAMVLAKRRDYYAQNRETEKARAREYRAKNPDKNAVHNRRWRAKHSALLRERRLARYRDDPEYRERQRAKTRAYRERKRGVAAAALNDKKRDSRPDRR